MVRTPLTPQAPSVPGSSLGTTPEGSEALWGRHGPHSSSCPNQRNLGLNTENKCYLQPPQILQQTLKVPTPHRPHTNPGPAGAQNLHPHSALQPEPLVRLLRPHKASGLTLTVQKGLLATALWQE